MDISIDGQRWALSKIHYFEILDRNYNIQQCTLTETHGVIRLVNCNIFGALRSIYTDFSYQFHNILRPIVSSKSLKSFEWFSRVRLKCFFASILNHSTLEIKNPSQKGLRILKTCCIDVFSNADSEKPHMTVGKNAPLMSYRRKTVFVT